MSGPIKDLEELRAWRQWTFGLVWMAVLLFLMQSGPASGQTDEEIEQVFWESVECESARQVQAYLEVYPTGRYLAEAWACLEGQLGLARAERVLVQQGLAALDYSSGPADGLFGGATRAAVRRWQRAKGEPVTGYLTQAQAETLMAQGREVVAEQRQREEAQQQAQAKVERKRQEEEARRQAQEAERQRVAEAERQAREAEARAEAERQRQAQEAEARAEAERQRQACEGRSEGAECWRELTDRPGCYVFDHYFEPSESVTWTGECSNGFASGMGTESWVGGGYGESVATGRLQDGKRYGHWVERIADGSVFEGPYVNDRRHGRGVIRLASGNVWEGPYVDGKMHGRWVGRLANGDVKELTYVNGEQQGQ